MRILILGASGMLGHKALEVLGRDGDCFGTIRPTALQRMRTAGFPESRLITLPGLPGGEGLEETLSQLEPDVLVNCIGLVKQDPLAGSPSRAIEVNALFPHNVAAHCSARGVRMIHVSTDCVFSGSAGRYSEADLPDAVDLYGRSKLLGEVTYDGHLTLRTSIVGRELTGSNGLVEWFLSQAGREVRGYESAFFSGLSTLTLAETLNTVIHDHRDLAGLYHVASRRIDKYNLLCLLDEYFGTATTIDPESSVRIDRSLNGKRFALETGISTPSWPVMVEDLVDDARRFAYEPIRAMEGGE